MHGNNKLVALGYSEICDPLWRHLQEEGGAISSSDLCILRKGQFERALRKCLVEIKAREYISKRDSGSNLPAVLLCDPEDRKMGCAVPIYGQGKLPCK